MIFNSIEFLLFAIGFFLLWPFLGKRSISRWTFITLASFFFYGWWDWRFLFLILASGLIDYFCALAIENRPKNRKLFFALSLIGNLGALSVFKYSKFFATVLEDTFATFNYKVDLVEQIPEFALILPVGISFYTFQSLSYTIDVYRGRLKPTRNILHFFSYLSMFPQLVAGPIIRAKDFLTQLNRYRVTNYLEKWNAIKMIAFGLFQKMVIADNLSLFIDSAFEGKSGFEGTAYWWVVMVAFSFQIYADFSGYSLIARGLAKYMGYHFRMNFNHPYLSKSLREFWTRWHISLSTWFRDYVYIALGGSRRGIVMGLIALAITMMLSGLWHGAKYTFLIWAAIHVVLLIFERLTNWTKLFRKSPLLIPIIFAQALVAWVYFRADNVAQGNQIINDLFSYSESNLAFYDIYYDSIFFLGLAVLIEFFVYLRKNYAAVKMWYWHSNLDVVLVSLAIISILFLRGEGKQFIYFQF
ncbi:MAG: alginate O-acetyltransferase complex protein AlgI [Crocinitomix sp.]|jgi:alginate O-acetyltransferase complex protein AlgI